MQYNRIIAPLVLITILSGCQTRFLSLERQQPSDIYQICSKLKRDIIFYNTDHNQNYQWHSPGQAVYLIQEYERYNCDNVLSNNGNVTYDNTPLSVPLPRLNGGPYVTVPTPPEKCDNVRRDRVQFKAMED